MKKEEVSSPYYEDVIRRSWKSDESLINTWHINSGKGLESCVEDTMKVLSSDVDKTTFRLYLVRDGKDEIGFFGWELYNETPFLTTFFVRPEHRDRKDEFLNLIFDTLGDDFDSALYAKNTRAVNWLIKNGAVLKGTFFLENGNDVVMLNIKR